MLKSKFICIYPSDVTEKKIFAVSITFVFTELLVATHTSNVAMHGVH